MDGQESHSPLPFAALSLHALAPSAVSRVSRPRPVSAPISVSGVRDGPRSHPIVAQLPDTEAERESSNATQERSSPLALTRLLAAVPAALGRLISGPIHQSPFTSGPRLSDARVFPSAVRRRAGRGSYGRPVGGAGRKPALVWFRNDLRLHDNPSLERACREGTSVLPVYVFDPRDYNKTPGGFDRTGPSRARFILDSVADLRTRLRAAGSDLVVRVGRPEEVLAGLARDVGAGAVFCQGEVTAEEAQVEGRVRASLDRDGCELRRLWGGTLYHLEDLPFRLDAMPTSYADFRARVAGLAVRAVVDSEGALRGLPQGAHIEPGELPSLAQLGLSAPPTPAAAAAVGSSGFGAPLVAGGGGARGLPALRGGETEALRHLQAFIAELKTSLARASKGSSHQQRTTSSSSSPSSSSSSSTFSCRISPWLALGCLSPRRMYHEMRQQLGSQMGLVGKQQQQQQQKTGNTGNAAGPGGPASWLVFELLWRDFFRFVTQKYATHSKVAQAGKGAAAGAGVGVGGGRTLGSALTPAAAPALVAA